MNPVMTRRATRFHPMTKTDSVALRLTRLYLDILSDFGQGLGPGTRTLDFGCGDGATVAALLDLGIDAHGCDFKFKTGPAVAALSATSRIKLIRRDPYRLPYENGSFDLIVSNQVFEHVQNYPETLAELRRVLKPEGLSVHLFPARWKPIESHVFVPFASVVRNKPWLRLWAYAGIRRKSQRRMTAADVARANRAYLDRATNYLSQKQILDHFRRHFGDVRFAERSFLKHSPHRRGRQFHALGVRLPLLFQIYRTFWARALVAS